MEKGEIVLYQPGNTVELEVGVEEETVWLTHVSDLIKSAKKSIVLIDNYIDETVLMMLSKHGDSVAAKIITKNVSRQFQQDLDRHNLQYPPIDIEIRSGIHDRFLIVDDTVYHIGASLKDLGKKLFAFSKMEIPPGIIFVLIR